MHICTLCYAVLLPGWKSGFRAGFHQDSGRENIKIGSPAGLWPAAGPILMFAHLESDPRSGSESRFPARKHYCVT